MKNASFRTSSNALQNLLISKYISDEWKNTTKNRVLFQLQGQTWPLMPKNYQNLVKIWNNSWIVCYIFIKHRSSSVIKGRTFLLDNLWPPKSNLTAEVNLDLWDQSKTLNSYKAQIEMDIFQNVGYFACATPQLLILTFDLRGHIIKS